MQITITIKVMSSFSAASSTFCLLISLNRGLDSCGQQVGEPFLLELIGNACAIFGQLGAIPAHIGQDGTLLLWTQDQTPEPKFTSFVTKAHRCYPSFGNIRFTPYDAVIPNADIVVYDSAVLWDSPAS